MDDDGRTMTHFASFTGWKGYTRARSSSSSSSRFGRRFVLMMVTKFEPWQTNLLEHQLSRVVGPSMDHSFPLSLLEEVRTNSRRTCADYRASWSVGVLRKFFSSFHFGPVSGLSWSYLHFKFSADGTTILLIHFWWRVCFRSLAVVVNCIELCRG